MGYQVSFLPFLFSSLRIELCLWIYTEIQLQIEIGRYIGLPVEQRICRSCNTRQVEDEHHFCVGCPALKKARAPLLHLSVVVASTYLVLSLNASIPEIEIQPGFELGLLETLGGGG